MSPWTLLLIGGVVALVGTTISAVGYSRLKQLEESISLTVPPSVELTIDGKGKSVPDVILANTGQHKLKDIDIWGIRYDVTNGRIGSRMASSAGTRVANFLDPRNRVSIPADKILWGPPLKPRTENELNLSRYIAFVTVYRRQDDNRRFVDVEVALVENIEGDLVIFHYLNSGSGGPPQKQVRVMKEIVDTEKFIFKAG